MRNLPRETVLHEILQWEFFPCAAVLHELLQCGSFWQGAVPRSGLFQGQSPMGPQVLPGACSNMCVLELDETSSIWHGAPSGIFSQKPPLQPTPITKPCHINWTHYYLLSLPSLETCSMPQLLLQKPSLSWWSNLHAWAFSSLKLLPYGGWQTTCVGLYSWFI